MNKLRAVLIDDEKNNLDLLSHFIKKYCDDVEIISECLTYKDALLKVDELKPDLLFLDIVLDENTAFDLLNDLKFKKFNIIFTTAYDEYAVKAFRYNTADYLLKPILIDDLILAVEKVIAKAKELKFLQPAQINNLSNSVLGKHPMDFLTISGADRIDFIDPNEIIYMQSNGRYTEFILSDNKRKVLASKSLGEIHVQLNPSVFFRIHNTFIINLKHLININKKSGNYCEMSNGNSLPISRRRYEGLMKYLRSV